MLRPKSGAGNATATANATGVLFQFGVTTSADYAINNTGRLLIDASAFAAATGLTGSALANAHLNAGLHQVAHVTSNAALAIDNTGTMTFAAVAHAVAPSSASANANLGTGGIYPTDVVLQSATGSNASVKLTNSGTVNIAAIAIASGGSVANANATIGNGIHQVANASSAGTATLDNAAGGVINISANASASASTANGSANAHAQIGATDF